MASSAALRRVVVSTLIGRASNSVRSAAPVAARSFNTNTQLKTSDDEPDRDTDVGRRTDRSVYRLREPSFLSDVFDPFSATRSLSQVLNMMDRLMESPLPSVWGAGGGSRRAWNVKEDNDALFLRMDMPGLGKEDVKVSVEQNTLTIKGQGEKELEEEDSGRKYSSRIEFPPNLYKLGEIKAEMKNGVLRVLVPKVKEDQRKDVYQVKIE